MIPFANTWPYETIRKDLYVDRCPFCSAERVLLPLKPEDLPSIRDGRKHLLVFPCCHGSVRVVDADRDYLLTDRKLR
jgi:hypothetical protein